jgi:hypothetical protein
MKNGGIKLSPQHGVNPMLVTCFWCGKEEGSLALLGRLKGDAEAPRHGAVDYEPCAACKEQWDAGIALVEMVPADGQHPELVDGMRPTGRYLVVKEDAVRRMIHPPALLEQVLRWRRAYIEPAVWTQIVGEHQQ